MRAAQRKKATWGDLLIALSVLIFAAVLMAAMLSRPARALTAQVLLDGEVIYSCRLDELEDPIYYSVAQAAYPITLEFSLTGVRVAKTACPGEDCRHMGTIATSARQIICLPNHLVVTLQGDDLSYDAMTG